MQPSFVFGYAIRYKRLDARSNVLVLLLVKAVLELHPELLLLIATGRTGDRTCRFYDHIGLSIDPAIKSKARD